MLDLAMLARRLRAHGRAILLRGAQPLIRTLIEMVVLRVRRRKTAVSRPGWARDPWWDWATGRARLVPDQWRRLNVLVPSSTK